MLLFVLAVTVLLAQSAAAQRIKDIASIQGARENHLKAIGMVVGLNGSGDSAGALSTRPLANMLNRLNLNVSADKIKSRNVALVMVTAMLPPFTRPGKTIDVTVSSLADAKSLAGGVLLPTYLRGPGFRDETVYAVAQGNVSVPKTHGTNGSITNGAIVEESIKTQLTVGGKVVVLLDKPDFTTAQVVANNLNNEPDLYGQKFWQDRALRLRRGERLSDPPPIARAVDGAKVEIMITPAFQNNVVGFISVVEQVSVTVHNEARIVINERTGVVIINSHVRVRPVAIVHPTVTLNVPPPAGAPQTVVPLGVAPTTQLQQIIDGLNAMRVTPKDLIDIIKELKAAGAIQAKVILR